MVPIVLESLVGMLKRLSPRGQKPAINLGRPLGALRSLLRMGGAERTEAAVEHRTSGRKVPVDGGTI